MPNRTNPRVAAFAAIMLGATALPGCASVGEIQTIRVASATLVSANGSPVGSAQMVGVGARLTLTVTAASLPEGVHGLHLHSTGRCDAPGFTTAGAHLNPAGHRHGTLNPGGGHFGDLPNLTIARSGAGTVTAALEGTRATLESALFDADGTAIVIHASPDDYKTDPSGNSGARIACGVLTPG